MHILKHWLSLVQMSHITESREQAVSRLGRRASGIGEHMHVNKMEWPPG